VTERSRAEAEARRFAADAGAGLGLTAQLLVAFAAAPLPEPFKRRWGDLLLRADAHVVSGVVEALTGLAVFAFGARPFLRDFTETWGTRYVTSKPQFDTGELMGIGVMGLIAYLFTPTPWIALFHLFEGAVRAVEAATTGRCRGMAVLAVPYLAVVRGARAFRLLDLERKLGPARPDKVSLEGEPGKRTLELVTGDARLFGRGQILRYDGELYVQTSHALVKMGDHHRFRYRFRELFPGEIVRGEVFDYASRAFTPAEPPSEPSN